MVPSEVSYVIDLAIEHTVSEQQKLLGHKRVAACLPLVKSLNELLRQVHQFKIGKHPAKNPANALRQLAKEIEVESDEISEREWVWIPVNLSSVFDYLAETGEKIRGDKTFTKRLRAHLDSSRIGLLQQIAGARMLENNSDLGEQVERILIEYLRRVIGNSVRVIRGGHIYDYQDNRSAQMDIIVTTSDALPFCPADVEEGRYNVMIDQVIAAISVKSTLDEETLSKAWAEIQSIPSHSRLLSDFSNLQGHAWPLCFIVGANCHSFKEIGESLETHLTTSHQRELQMLMVLEKGYSFTWESCWPIQKLRPDAPKHLRTWQDEYAGQGLGWLCLSILARNAVIKRQALDWINCMAEQLRKNEFARPCIAGTSRFDHWFIGFEPIHGVLKWGRAAKHPHNRITLWTLDNGKERPLPTDPAIPSTSSFDQGVEPRWFRLDVVCKCGKYCAFEEWVDPRTRESCKVRVAVFDSETGEEMTEPKFVGLTSVHDLMKFDTRREPS